MHVGEEGSRTRHSHLAVSGSALALVGLALAAMRKSALGMPVTGMLAYESPQLQLLWPQLAALTGTATFCVEMVSTMLGRRTTYVTYGEHCGV